MHYRITFFLMILQLHVCAQTTYYQHIKPLLSKHCIDCHQTQESAPFSLDTYEETKAHARMIAQVTKSTYMPPWKANRNYRHFANERGLDSIEIQTIQQWVEEGCLMGTKIKESNTKSKKRKPDLILRMPVPINVPGDLKQHYFSVKIPFEIEQSKAIEAIEFKPGNSKIVHHASFQILSISNQISTHKTPYFFEYQAENNPIEGDQDFIRLGLTDSLSAEKPKLCMHAGWLPGTGKQTFPAGIGYSIPKKGVLLIRNIHYVALPIPASDQSEVHIYYAQQPIHRNLEFAAFKPKNVKPIIPKDSVVSYQLTLRIGSDISLYMLNPHMHKIGKKFKAWIVTPNQQTIPLIDIPDWDYQWQAFYQFEHLLKIPKGSFLNAVATYDNTVRNPNNPHNPPIDIGFEKGNMDDETEEMMRLVFIYLPYRENDENLDLKHPKDGKL